MRQRVTYGGNFNNDGEGKFTKFYSEDGSFEIVKDNLTGKEKHILYIEGTPYESNIIFLKNYDETNGSYKFLHKDYLGSILAISDEDGNKLEQRHYDAWGNFTHLMLGNGPVITDKNIINTTSLIVDRGYTGHEHFAEVGIIHMNGRLYDPLLRRFLNADENIQEPYNTQNYNKYGYVLNNPLMYNDPTGEVFQFLIAAGVAVFWATVLTGAIISSAIATFLYLAKAYLTKNFSVGGFLKAVTLGSITGAVTAGLGQVFSAGTFLATVGNGALAGAGGGAIQALSSGTNFLQGLAKGAVIGAVTGAISWKIGKMMSSSQDQIKLNAEGSFSYDGQKFANEEELMAYIKKTSGNPAIIMKKLKISSIELASDTNLPAPDEDKITKFENGFMMEYQKDAMGNSIANSRSQVLATTIRQEGYSKIFVSPGLKGVHLNGHYLAKTFINHEFIHSYHLMKGLTNKTYLERSAWSYNFAYAREHNLNVSNFVRNLGRFSGLNIPNAYKYSKMNIFQKKVTLAFLIISSLYSCNKKEDLEDNITVSESNRYISTSKGIVVYTSTSYTEGDKSDTFKIKFSNKDWNILRNSFNKNQIYSIDNDLTIGEKSNSLTSYPKKMEIKTNKRVLKVTYNYFIGNETIDYDKSKKFKQFMRTFDSLIYYKTIKK
jgi:RHS repeat-associated protein